MGRQIQERNSYGQFELSLCGIYHHLGCYLWICVFHTSEAQKVAAGNRSAQRGYRQAGNELKKRGYRLQNICQAWHMDRLVDGING